MPRKRRREAEGENSCDFATTTIVTAFKPKHPHILEVLERIQRSVSEAMTLATKLGSLYLLEQLECELPMNEFYSSRTFWRWCLEMVTTLRSKPSVLKISKYRQRASKPPKQRPNEDDQVYANRIIQLTSDKKQAHDSIAASKGVIKPALYTCWQRLKTLLGPGFVYQPRDYLTAINEPLLCAYETNLKVYIRTTLEKRMSRAISSQVAALLRDIECKRSVRSNLHGAVLGYMMRKIKGDEPPNWQEKRKTLVERYISPEIWSDLEGLIGDHRRRLPAMDQAYRRGVGYGLFNDDYIEAHPVSFLAYLRYLSGLQTKSFAILPQWNAKARHIRLNKWSLQSVYTVASKVCKMDLSTWFPAGNVFDSVYNKEKKQINKKAWESMQDVQVAKLFQILFVMPRINTRRRFGLSLSTNLVTTSWLIDKPVTVSVPKHNKRVRRTVDTIDVPIKAVSELGAGLYFHGTDFFLQEDIKTNWVFIDPGHVNIMYGIRERTGSFNPRDVDRYRLTNRHYQTITGMRKRRAKSQARRDRDTEATRAWEELSENSFKTWDPGQFRDHIMCTSKHWTVLFNHAFKPYLRHFRFANYQAKQRVIKQIVTGLSPGSERTIVVVGNGVSRATSKGHDAAPGKALRRSLARFLPIVMTDERYTTARSACCHESVRYGRYDEQSEKAGRKIRGLLHCSCCGATLDRDHSAALNIRTLFRHHMETRTLTNILK